MSVFVDHHNRHPIQQVLRGHVLKLLIVKSFFSALDSELEANAIGLSIPSLQTCERTAPNPYWEASVAN